MRGCTATNSAREVKRMADAPLPEWQARRVLAAFVVSRIERGETTEAVRADLIARGMTPETAAVLVAKFAPRRWTLGPWGQAGRAVGLTALFAGCGFALGNRFGFFPTFPFAGTLAITLGAWLFTMAGGKWYRTASPPKPVPDESR